MSQKRYNQEFKQTVVELYHTGTPVSQLSSEYGVSENVLNQDFTTTTINEKWVADITYVHTLRDG